jgi:lipoprotein-anchoring transpeptidase ErfK/SrfK
LPSGRSAARASLAEHSGRTSGRITRPLVLSFVALVFAASASAAEGAVPAKQKLVRLMAVHDARSAPTGDSHRIIVISSRRPITGERTVLPVLAHRAGWLKVLLPGRPNGHTGWIRARNTQLTSTAWHIVVRTSSRNVLVYRSGHLVRTFTAIIGKPSTPTPRGEFFVEEAVELTRGEVGAPYALALSARSTVLQEFAGGPGQIALHGLANVGGTLGTATSHGCVRMRTSAMRWLITHFGIGVPVTIR